MIIKVKELKPGFVPKKGSTGAAAFDCFAAWSKYNKERGFLEVGLGFSIEVPEGNVMKLFPRSSVSNKGLSLANSVGIIDPDFRGEVVARFYPNASSMMAVNKDATQQWVIDYCESLFPTGTGCAQFTIEKIEEVTLELTEELTETERGEGGFGSTDAV